MTHTPCACCLSVECCCSALVILLNTHTKPLVHVLQPRGAVYPSFFGSMSLCFVNQLCVVCGFPQLELFSCCDVRVSSQRQAVCSCVADLSLRPCQHVFPPLLEYQLVYSCRKERSAPACSRLNPSNSQGCKILLISVRSRQLWGHE